MIKIRTDASSTSSEFFEASRTGRYALLRPDPEGPSTETGSLDLVNETLSLGMSREFGSRWSLNLRVSGQNQTGDDSGRGVFREERISLGLTFSDLRRI